MYKPQYKTKDKVIKNEKQLITDEINKDINFDIQYNIESQWETGFTAKITIKNTGSVVITPWELKFHFPGDQRITSLWNGNFKQQDQSVAITNVDYNKEIQPSKSVSIGFTATYFGENHKPTDFTLNGQTPVIEFGFIEVNVEKPIFSEEIFKPKVTIGNITQEIDWGEKVQFQLNAGVEYVIEANEYKDEKYIYKPDIKPEKVKVQKDVTNEVRITYERKAIPSDIHFNVIYNIESQWQNGFIGKIVIENTGQLVITPWELKFNFPGNQQIDSLWNGNFEQQGQGITITNVDYNKEIHPGKSVEVGFSASFSGINNKPTNFTLNGKGPVIEYGFVKVNVAKPTFSEFMFKPQVTIDNTTKEVSWGGNVQFKLQAGLEYGVEANSYKGEKFIYIPNISLQTVVVEKDVTKEVDIVYEQIEINENVFCGYFPSWKERWSSTGQLTDLGNLPSYVNRVLLAFGKPDMVYNEEYDISQTGLEFSYDAAVLKEAIDYLKQRNPETKVLISIGGATYFNWKGFNEKAIARFVKDFNLDGVDIDYEPNIDWGCKPDGEGVIHCITDNEYISLIERMRRELPRPYIISTAPFSVGAYGEGEWKDALPSGLTSTGMMLEVIKRAGDKLDIINVQGYNAGPEFDPLQATKAYHYYFKGIVAMGAMVPPEDWSTGLWTVDKIYRVGTYINDNNIGGMMLWDLYRKTPIADSQTMSSAIAKVLGFKNYNDPLFPLNDSANLISNKIRALAPQKPNIYYKKHLLGNGYDIILSVEKGINATSCILYQNGEPIDYIELEDQTPQPQKEIFKIDFNPQGIYTYRIELINEYGSTFSEYLVVKIDDYCSK